MKRFLALCLIVMAAGTASAQVVINEVFMNPAQDATDPEYQSMADCATTSHGYEWVELYNPSRCDTVDLECFVLGAAFSATNGGSMRFQSGTVIPPLGFLVVGGPNVPEADFVVSDFCATTVFCGTTNWNLPNDNGWIAIYDTAGNVADAVFWTATPSSQNDKNTLPVYDNEPCTPANCNNGILISARDMSLGTDIQYANQAPGPGLVAFRTTDGTGVWQTDGNPTPGACNGPCNPPSDLDVDFVDVVEESCEENNGSITAVPSGGSGVYSFSWNNGDNDSIIFNLSNGLYTLTLQDSEGCQVIDTTTLTNIGDSLDAEIVPSQVTIFTGESVDLEVLGSAVIDSAIWSPDDDLSCNNCTNPTSSPGSSVDYIVELVDVNGCEATATATVTVLSDENSVFIPTGFSPNDDNNNDILFVRSPRIENMTWTIYDRWGKEVFVTNDQDTGWDGTDKRGVKVNTGVYVYVLDVEFDNGNTRVIKGNVTLFR